MDNQSNILTSLNRREQEMETLQGIINSMSRCSGPRKVLHEVVVMLDNTPWFVRSTIMLLSPDGRELLVETIRDRSSAEFDDVRYARGEGITGRVLQTGQPAVIPCIREEPVFRDRIHRRRQGEEMEFGFICVPITLGQETIGTLSADVHGSQRERLNELCRFLRIVSGLIANDVKVRRYARQEKDLLEEENFRLRTQLKDRYRPENIIGNSNEMQAVYQRIHQVARSETTVLIRGESGTGKELVASAIHYSSDRSNKPLVKVNCAALSENLLESELFGHEKGAFTGALYTRVGRIEQADGGTLFLDEIGDFSPAIQVKLLRVLQEREYERVGSNVTNKADVRVIAATNRNLEADVEAGRFRQDLYYRINVFPMFLPALRDRREDILQLIDFFSAKYAGQMGKEIHRISTEAIDMMMAYHWPGNVRELENCIEHAVLLSSDGVIHGYSLPPTLQVPKESAVRETGNLKTAVQLLEKDMIIDALKQTKGNVAAAARSLGITPRMVRYKFKILNIDYKKLFRKSVHAT